jgi:hypothetical protein
MCDDYHVKSADVYIHPAGRDSPFSRVGDRHSIKSKLARK